MLFKPQSKNKIPASATRITRKGVLCAVWTNRQGKKTTAEIKTDGAGNEYVYLEAGKWYARYTDSAGRRVTRNTKCTDRSAAAAVLARWRGTTERVLAGYVRAADEHATTTRGKLTIEGVLSEYVGMLTQAGRSDRHIAHIKHVITAIKDHAGIHRLIDLDRLTVERYLTHLHEGGLSARTLNHHKAIVHGFCKYCLQHGHIDANPCNGMASANQATDRRHIRRAMTDDEITAFLDAAERRPLENFLHGNTGPVDPKKIKPETIKRYKTMGREHRLMYEVLLITALRWSELRAVTVGDCVLEGDAPHIRLKASSTKSKKADTVPLTRTLADSLKAWIRQTSRIGKARLFDMPDKGTHVFHRDRAAAKIPRETDEGVLDIHALRHTAATRLARNGVPLATTQRIMRHSTPTLTAAVYTHLGILDTAAAVESLPALGTDTAKVKEKK